MKKKILLSSFILIIISFIIVSGISIIRSNQMVMENKKTIAVSVIGPTHSWAKAVEYYAKKEVEKVAKENGWDYIVSVGNDSNEQSQQVIELANKKVDCIVMIPMDGASLKTAATVVQKANIPIVIFDREIPDFAPTATVKGDNAGIGIKTAEILNNYFDKNTTVLEIMGDTSTVPFQRTDGYNNTIADSFTTIQIGYAEWQRKVASNLFTNWLETASQEERSTVGAIYTHDDEIALGVLDILDEYKNRGESILPNLKVIAGSSGSQEMFRRIEEEDDYSLFSLTYSPSMIEYAIRTAEKIIKDEDYEEMMIFPTLKIDKKNVQEYIDPNSPF